MNLDEAASTFLTAPADWRMYSLQDKPNGFDINLLRASWDRWREASEIAS
jgi:hypothetical protein